MLAKEKLMEGLDDSTKFLLRCLRKFATLIPFMEVVAVWFIIAIGIWTIYQLF